MTVFADVMAGADAWVQYGCFGLLAGLVVWSLRHGIPGALKIHKETMQDLTQTFRDESEACRKERIQTAVQAAAERELDRKARHEVAGRMQELVAVLQKKSDK